MPEGPELYLSSKYINKVCKDHVFGGKVEKSDVSKNPAVDWDCPAYTISACSRGKEIKVILTDITQEIKSNDSDKRKLPNTMAIVVRFGMSGIFKFTKADDLPKHSHLRFYTVNDDTNMVLSFVDARRFGHWEVNGDWTPNRSPDPIYEYELFRKNVLSNLKDAAFNKPICEVIMNQKYFNGIGNYLRAEILHRAKVPPFQQARAVLEKLDMDIDDGKVGDGTNASNSKQVPDVLELCHICPTEVIDLGGGKWYQQEDTSTNDDRKEDAFVSWLQCYFQPGMNTLFDHNRRTIWFQGDPGPMVPKGGKSRGKLNVTPGTPKKDVKTKSKVQKNGQLKQKLEDHLVTISKKLKKKMETERTQSQKSKSTEELEEPIKKQGRRSTKKKNESTVDSLTMEVDNKPAKRGQRASVESARRSARVLNRESSS